jgi:ABC-type glycerol-3-phosphate transport system substrate-binding protein
MANMLNKRLTRRELLKWAGVTAGSVALSACAPASPEPPPTPEPETIVVTATPLPAAPGRKTIRWWDIYPDTDPKSVYFLEKVVPEFQKENPGWEVEYTYASGEELVTKFLTARMAGVPPDIFQVFSGRGSLYHAGYCLPLQDFFKEIGIEDDMIRGFRDVVTIAGDVIAYPSRCATKMWVYRKDFFEEAGLDPEKFPDDWDEYVDAAIKLTKRDAQGNITRAGSRHTGRTFDAWEEVAIRAFQNGGTEFDPADPVTGTSAITEPAFAEAFTWDLDIKRVHKILPLEGMELPPGAWPTIEGYTAMEYQAPWWVPNMRKRAPESYALMGVGAPLARHKGGKRIGLNNAGIQQAVYAESEVQDAALALLEVYARKEHQIQINNAVDPESKRIQYAFTCQNSWNADLPWVAEEPLVRDTGYTEYLGQGSDVSYGHVGYMEMLLNVIAPYRDMALFGMMSDEEALATMAGEMDRITDRILKTGA